MQTENRVAHVLREVLTRGFRKNLPTVLVCDKFPYASIGEFFPLVLQQHLKIKKENKYKSNTF